MEAFLVQQKLVHDRLLKKETFDEGLALCELQNQQLHASPQGKTTILDRLVEGLPASACAYQPPGEFETIAWAIWHLTRIEDAVGSLLIANTEQVFDSRWQRRINSPIRDTGNALGKEECQEFSLLLHVPELFAYRRAVGERSQSVIRGVTYEKSRNHPDDAWADRVVENGVLTTHPESIWLRDFWASKTIAGLLLLPLTRHHTMHLPNCFRLKEMAPLGSPPDPDTRA